MTHLFRLLICFGLLSGVLVGLPAVSPPFTLGTVLAQSSGPTSIYIPLLVNGSILSDPAQSPATLQDFIQSVERGDAGVVKGVFAAGVLAQPVVQQPDGNYSFISTDSQDVTQFSLAQAPVTGLMAHNTLAGSKFFKLVVDQDIYLVLGDGSAHRYRVSQIDRYQAVHPDDAASDFINEQTSQVLSAAQLFADYYLGPDHVTLQTCILEDGNPSWGRLFVVAFPED